MDAIEKQMSGWLEEKGISLSAAQWKQFHDYYELLIEWNRKMNLTAITERAQVYIKHFYDSLSLSFVVPMAKMANLADIGSGSGFPGIPLKIAFPHLQVTIIDSLNKRITFLRHVVERLELKDVVCVHSRAEDSARDTQLRDRFDLATARAVARLNVLNELCLPFVKPNGLFAAMKGAQGEEELADAGRSLQALKGKVEKTVRFELPVEDAARTIILIRKTAATPAKYPRKAGIPSKQPLV
jgi:16S rRNA (guanine527-N7)-methyltransferase